MKLVVRAFLTAVICLIVIPTALGRNPGAQPAVTVAGIYDNFTVGKESGDLEGMRVVLAQAGGGYYAIVQIAQGGAEDPKPEFVPAEVKGRSVSFSIGDDKYIGTATAAELTLKHASGQSHSLKRKACSSYFK